MVPRPGFQAQDFRGEGNRWCRFGVLSLKPEIVCKANPGKTLNPKPLNLKPETPKPKAPKPSTLSRGVLGSLKSFGLHMPKPF